MKKRCIVCTSRESFKLLCAWLPTEISTSSRFFVSRGQINDIDCTQDVIMRHAIPALLIRNAQTTDEDLIGDQYSLIEDILLMSCAPQAFDVEIVAPALEAMLFETQALFDAIFREHATELLKLMGSYDPARALRETGLSIDDIITSLDDAARELMRATPTARAILDGIARLDAKAFEPLRAEGSRLPHPLPQLTPW
ncbi:hypothetical protein [Pandoraea pulmonicola]|uniref:Uncharacterized protein n=1 Tax=Pandoraea pulmonicola TaxID=93221 RepID=A0AAJ4ZCF9_PANPU|nr:hypothetical protein [Pandoraea pulmonicola]AJC20736.1 hypothetical protein RO07_10105 [Pandoraea pulmonicola]SUA90745.1 Uncharacterised protein [Pandoraea pulmonicola]